MLGIDDEIQKIRQFFQALGDPEYFHLWLEPLLTWGLVFGVITFLFSLVIREQKTQFFALAIIIGSALLVSTYIDHREAAEERIVGTYRIDQPARANGFSNQTLEWKDMRGVYWCVAGLASFGLILGAGKTVFGTILSSLATVLALWAILAGWQFHYDESQLVHPNLRTSSWVASEGGESGP